MLKATPGRMVLKSYASGGGAIEFCWQELEDGRQVAANRKVLLSEAKRHLASEDCKSLLDKGWRIVKLEGRFKLVAPISRIDDCHLRYGDRVYNYNNKGTGETYNYHDVTVFTFFDVVGHSVLVENIGIKSAIVHFLNNEAALAGQP